MCKLSKMPVKRKLISLPSLWNLFCSYCALLARRRDNPLHTGSSLPPGPQVEGLRDIQTYPVWPGPDATGEGKGGETA